MFPGSHAEEREHARAGRSGANTPTFIANTSEQTTKPAVRGRSLLRAVLFSLFCLGTLTTVITGNTMASFQATASHPTNSFAAGTVLMTNGSCVAVSSGTSCGSLFTVNNTGLVPGDYRSATFTLSNSGSLPATIKLSVGSVTDASSLGAQLNFTVHDDSASNGTTNRCLFGASGAPVAGSCDNISSALTAVGGNTGFSTFITHTAGGGSEITIPGAGGSSQWAAGEQHTFTATVQVISAASVPINASLTVPLVWSGQQ